ncbi:MAG TPA: COP23 domain-containing protein [Stenomitos sp.]
MTPQQFTRNSSLKPLLFKSVGWSASVAILLASGNALALTQNRAATTAPSQLSQHTILAQDVEEETPSQDSATDSEIKSSQQPRFTCEPVNGQYTVMYHPESQPNQAYPWATPSALGGGWTPELRCNEISRRLELYRPDGLVEMRNAVENNYNTVCVTTQKNSSCRIVLTVPPGQDPELTRNRVFQNLTIADTGERTDAVNTFVEGDRGSQLLNQVLNQGLSALGIDNNPSPASGNINLRPFLDRADGGTGSRLRRSIPVRSNPRLNPDRFR